jgi:hypothetical protein
MVERPVAIDQMNLRFYKNRMKPEPIIQGKCPAWPVFEMSR